MYATHDVIVVGAGPGGLAFAATAAAGGAHVLAMDGCPPGLLKPCGGCFPITALGRIFPEVEATLRPRTRRAREVVLRSPGEAPIVAAVGRSDLAVCRRDDLDSALLDAVLSAGAQVAACCAECGCLESGLWHVSGGSTAASAPVLIGADGWMSAASGVRSWCLEEPAFTGPILEARGVYVAGEFDSSLLEIDLPDMPGYVWSFYGPSVGSIGALAPAASGYTDRVRDAAADRLVESGLSECVFQRYHCRMPCVGAEARESRISDRHFALVGDAAGLIDPITGAGILYALASGVLAAEHCLRKDLPGYHDALWASPEGVHLAGAGRGYSAACAMAEAVGPWPIHALIQEAFSTL